MSHWLKTVNLVTRLHRQDSRQPIASSIPLKVIKTISCRQPLKFSLGALGLITRRTGSSLGELTHHSENWLITRETDSSLGELAHHSGNWLINSTVSSAVRVSICFNLSHASNTRVGCIYVNRLPD